MICDYSYQIAAFTERFPRNRILVLFLEDMRSDFEGFMNRVFDFLEVPQQKDVQMAKLNAGDNLQAPSVLAKSIQHIPGIYRWGKYLPRSFREQVARALFCARPGATFLIPWRSGGAKVTQPVPKPYWETELLKEVLDGVEERAKRFLQEAGNQETSGTLADIARRSRLASRPPKCRQCEALCGR